MPPLVVSNQRPIQYEGRPKRRLDTFIVNIECATPSQRIELERSGVSATLIADVAKHIHIPETRILSILGISRATAARKVASGAPVNGLDGILATGLAELVGLAQEIVNDSTSLDADGFDVGKWFGEWIETPQVALGGRRPDEFLDTKAGQAVVAKVLGAIRSGAYV